MASGYIWFFLGLFLAFGLKYVYDHFYWECPACKLKNEQEKFWNNNKTKAAVDHKKNDDEYESDAE